MKAYYDHQPSKLQSRGDGSFLYRYNIEEYTHEGEEGATGYKCDEVVIYNLAAENIMKAVLEDHCDLSRELKLVNEYNAAILGLLSADDTEKAKTAYSDYLVERKNLHDMVDADCKELSIA